MEYSWSFILPFLVIIHTVSSSVVVEEYACFSQLFQIKCQEEELIVFEHARYGRNDTHLAAQCGVPFTRRCDIDVNFSLNRVCAGKQTCNIAVNTALFGDPCGYEEFLKVKYRCVPVSTIAMSCESSRAPQHFDHGYLASPNYPAKYYMDAECFWKLSVQKRQTIKLTIFDFELDVKKGGKCTDYLEVFSGDRTYFKDCGSLGKQEIEIDASDAVVRFKTSSNSLTQRGFFIYFEAIGPGCPDIEDFASRRIEYFIESDNLYANATCQEGFIFRGTDNADFQQIRCTGAFWSTQVGECIEIPPPTTPAITEATTARKKTSAAAGLHNRSSVVGIALGIVSAILLITLLLMLALYFHRSGQMDRRRNAERKLDLARVVINNLQDGGEMAAADENYKNMNVNEVAPPHCNNRKNKKRKKNNKDSYIEGDPMSGRNLLPQYAGYDEDEYIMDYADCYREFPNCDSTTTPVPKTPDSLGCAYGYVTRKNSSVGRANKYGLTRSREGSLDPDYDKARAKREFNHRRAKSGQWDPPPMNRSLIYAPIPAALFSAAPRSKVCTQSAPDLMQLLHVSNSAGSSVATSPDAAPPLPPPRPTPQRGSGGMNPVYRSATLGRKQGSSSALSRKARN